MVLSDCGTAILVSMLSVVYVRVCTDHEAGMLTGIYTN